MRGFTASVNPIEAGRTESLSRITIGSCAHTMARTHTHTHTPTLVGQGQEDQGVQGHSLLYSELEASLGYMEKNQ